MENIVAEMEAKGKAIPVTGHGGSHIFRTLGSQMAVMLSSFKCRPPFTPGRRAYFREIKFATFKPEWKYFGSEVITAVSINI
jgi:hypothetical protein